ncbi:MAG: hypothetical protein CMK09_11735 [Ponticaulis sp.]|nr:hypothetical protein [Ponticaulis sp.]|tara:strand:+ start:3424 stop:6138 length:2715 start_codon:yes stop_codon:yes gene_type:complete
MSKSHSRGRFGQHTLLCAVSALAFISPTAFAQDTPEEETILLDRIEVKGFRGSLADSLDLKRNADQVIDAITAEELGQFPDQNVSEAIQRISGVQITRANGEGEAVNIRGLSSNFTRVEVDGRSASVTIDSSDPGRSSTLSVFSSDLYNTIEVIKSPTARNIEGGVGGIVRLKTPDPLDIGELAWGGDLGISQAEARDDEEPAFNAFYSNVFMEDRLGLLLAGTFEQRDLSLDKIQNNDDWRTIDSRSNGGTDPAISAFADARFFGRLRQEEREGDSDKLNLNAKLQFQATPNLELFANTVYTTNEYERTTSRLQVQFRRGRPQLLSNLYPSASDPIVVGDDGTVLQGAFSGSRVEPRIFFREGEIETAGLTGGFEWMNSDWTLSGDANFQKSEEDFREIRVGARFNALAGYSIVGDPEYPEITIEPGVFDLPSIDVRDLDLNARRITIEETSARFDAERELDFGIFNSFEVGARFASTEFGRKQGALDSPEEGGSLTFADGTPFLAMGEFADGFGGSGLLRMWPSISPSLYEMFPANEAFTFNDENLYDLTEETLAGYGLVNFDNDFGGLYARGNLGVRVVQTKYEGVGAVDLAGDAISDFGNVGTASLERDYTDVLPSFNVTLSKDQESNFLVRGAVSRAMTRPEISQIQPGFVVRVNDLTMDNTDNTFERGNPDLDPFRAWQYDLGFEWYFGENGEAALTAAVFAKDVENFVTTTQGTTSYQNNDFGIAMPVTLYNDNFAINGGEAEIKGFELGFQTPFTMLPEPFDGLGVAANYTFTDSEFTDADGNTQPFPGASENSFNLVGYYERGIFSGRVAYNYRDEFLIVPGSEENGDVVNAQYGDSQGRLDASVRLRFDNGLRLSLDALNLTEEQNFKYYDNTNRLEDLEVEGRIYTFTIGYVY